MANDPVPVRVNEAVKDTLHNAVVHRQGSGPTSAPPLGRAPPPSRRWAGAPIRHRRRSSQPRYAPRDKDDGTCVVRRLSTGLLAQIEAGALDSKTSLADTARKCVALGGHSGSAELRDWARQELNGYKGESIPAYRVVPAILAVDGHNFAHRITGQQISTSDLPEFARETLEPEVPLTSGVAELEVLAAKPGTLQIQHPGISSLVSYMNSTNDSGYAITSLYWKVGTSHVHGVVDTIRTMLVALVAELRASGIGEGPSAEAVDQAIKVIVHDEAPQV